MEKCSIEEISKDPIINIILDTLKQKKQALVFLNSKRSAEATARKIAEFLKKKENLLRNKGISIENKQLNYTLAKEATKKTQTHQCLALAQTLKEGIAFHHAGLTSDQKRLVEQNFKKTDIKVICCTPTLAIGMDLPAYRVIIRDLKRYTSTGMNYIPVLEYEQISGRAGRPGQETSGESIIIINKEKEKDNAIDRFIFGDVENIYSKLAVEPVFRTYLLSLISSQFVRTKKDIIDFFNKTFWSHQYQDPFRLRVMIENMLQLLEEFGFIRTSIPDKENVEKKINTNNNNIPIDHEFQSASYIHKPKKYLDEEIIYFATQLGKRVSELYLDPVSANTIICMLHAMNQSTTQEFKDPQLSEKALNYSNVDFSQLKEKEFTSFTIMHLFASLLEIRPPLGVKASDLEMIDEALVYYEKHFIYPIPTQFDFDYEDFLSATKTALFVQDWMDEKDEEFLLKKYNIRPGEIHAKIHILEWLCYGTSELCILLGYNELLKEISKLKVRVINGVREELLPLLRLKQVGRVRARLLYQNGLKDLGDLRKSPFDKLAHLIGKATALSIKDQIGENVSAQEYDSFKEKKKIIPSFDDEDKLIKKMKKSKSIKKDQSSLFDFT